MRGPPGGSLPGRTAPLPLLGQGLAKQPDSYCGLSHSWPTGPLRCVKNSVAGSDDKFKVGSACRCRPSQLEGIQSL